MLYTLYNKSSDKRLSHPKYGLWCTHDLEEAKEMMKACREYLISLHIPQSEFNNFVILNVESGQEIDGQ